MLRRKGRQECDGNSCWVPTGEDSDDLTCKAVRSSVCKGSYNSSLPVLQVEPRILALMSYISSPFISYFGKEPSWVSELPILGMNLRFSVLLLVPLFPAVSLVVRK